jgi:hypothetical protein
MGVLLGLGSFLSQRLSGFRLGRNTGLPISKFFCYLEINLFYQVVRHLDLYGFTIFWDRDGILFGQSIVIRGSTAVDASGNTLVEPHQR